MAEYEAHLRARYQAHVDELKAFLRLPSVSALSDHKADIVRTAEWLAGHLEEIGLEHAEVMATDGHPVVYADWLHKPDQPTVLLYGHYDVQPVDPLELWTSPPFEPSERDGWLYARGVSDDKGQVMLHLKALEALLATEAELPVNVRLLIEGEEEIGSPNLEPFIQTHAERIRADTVVVSDTAMFVDGMPTLCTGLRGIAALEVHVRTLKGDLHSGLYGGAVENPIHVLAGLLAGMRDADGRVIVPGFDDAVVALSDEDRTRLEALPFDEAAFLHEAGIQAPAGDPAYTVLERMTVRPTLDVNGIWGGFQGEGTKTVIPADAHAKITCRLVPDQDPHHIQRLVTDWLQTHAPETASVEVEAGHVARPWRCDTNAPPVQAAIRALERSYGRPVALAPVGGSIPVVETFDRLLGVPCVLMGFAPTDSRAHAPDERFPLETFRRAPAAICVWLHELARV